MGINGARNTGVSALALQRAPRAAVMVVLYNLPVDVLTAVLRDWIDINPSEDSILQPALGLHAQATAARATSGGRRVPSERLREVQYWLGEVTTQRWCDTDDLMPAYNLEVFLAPKLSGSIPFLR
jgi:hypothetical protein